MKGKILESYYAAENGLSVIIKQSKYGRFVGDAYCYEEDKDIQNQWDGCRLAEYKCDLQQLKVKLKEHQLRLKGMRIAYQNLAQNTDETNEVMLKLNKQINIAQRDVDALKDKYNYLKNNYSAYAEKILNERRSFRKNHSQD